MRYFLLTICQKIIHCHNHYRDQHGQTNQYLMKDKYPEYERYLLGIVYFHPNAKPHKLFALGRIWALIQFVSFYAIYFNGFVVKGVSGSFSGILP